MNGLKYFLSATCLLAAVLVSGCIVVSGEPVGVEETEISYAPPPPPIVIVTRPPPPSGLHIWIEGHHVVRSGSWVWVEGHWARPAHRGEVWVPDHTRQKGHAWGWTPGHWR